jgi:hypothetical protein
MHRATVLSIITVAGLLAGIGASVPVVTASAADAPGSTPSRQVVGVASSSAPRSEWLDHVDYVDPSGQQTAPDRWVHTEIPEPVFGPDGMRMQGDSIVRSTGSRPASELTALITASRLRSTGDARLTLAISSTGVEEKTDILFQAVQPGDVSASGLWRSYPGIGSIPQNTPATLAEFQAQLAASMPDATITEYAVSAAIDTSAPFTVASITWDGLATFFTPRPVGTLTLQGDPTSSSLTDRGVSFSATGFAPGEVVDVVARRTGQPDVVATRSFTADQSGNVVGTAVFASGLPVGDAAAVLSGRTSDVVISFGMTVSADPTQATPPDPTPAPVAIPVRGHAAFTG